MTETLLSVSNPLSGERRAGSVGLPVPGYELRIVSLDDDTAGADCAVGAEGELLVRGPGVMAGYWRNEAATTASFHDGFFRTGDVARRDVDGYVTIVGRSSTDIVKSGGFKIGTREIEDVLLTHPSVVEAAVVGVPDREWGQRLVAIVVPRPGQLADDLERALPSFVASKLADYKKPRAVLVVDALPRNALGKVQKHVLVERVVSGETKLRSAP
jgi:malonyl-CoA/methylmalonyl-CoA synthetase